MTEEKVIEILGYIEENLYKGIKTDVIASVFHFDRAYLSRSFKKITSISLIDYINERKIIKSINYIFESDYKILKIALDSGFNSLEYFSETFYRITNFSPSSLRNNHDVENILPFISGNHDLVELKLNHEKILRIRNLPKPKIKTIGIYK